MLKMIQNRTLLDNYIVSKAFVFRYPHMENCYHQRPAMFVCSSRLRNPKPHGISAVSLVTEPLQSHSQFTSFTSIDYFFIS